jgi:tetratricopeptide (TPR) repeat protein
VTFVCACASVAAPVLFVVLSEYFFGCPMSEGRSVSAVLKRSVSSHGSLLLVVIWSFLFLALYGRQLSDRLLANSLAIVTAKRAAPDSLALPAMALPGEWGDCLTAHAYGRDLLFQARYAEALPYLEKGVQCEDERWAWFDLGRAQFELDRWPEAGLSWQRANAYRHALGLADRITKQGDPEEALRAWEMAAIAGPNETGPYIRMVRLLEKTDPERAEQLLQTAVGANPGSAVLLKELSAFYQQQRVDWNLAIHYAGQAAAMAPGNASFQADLAAVYAGAGCVAEAISHYQQALALNPANSLKKNIETSLAKLTILEVAGCPYTQ